MSLSRDRPQQAGAKAGVRNSSVSGPVWAPFSAYSQVPRSLPSSGDVSLSTWALVRSCPQEYRVVILGARAILHAAMSKYSKVRRWWAAWVLRDREALLAPPTQPHHPFSSEGTDMSVPVLSVPQRCIPQRS